VKSSSLKTKGPQIISKKPFDQQLLNGSGRQPDSEDTSTAEDAQVTSDANDKEEEE
jgi:hypothetical protein